MGSLKGPWDKSASPTVSFSREGELIITDSTTDTIYLYTRTEGYIATLGWELSERIKSPCPLDGSSFVETSSNGVHLIAFSTDVGNGVKGFVSWTLQSNFLDIIEDAEGTYIVRYPAREMEIFNNAEQGWLPVEGGMLSGPDGGFALGGINNSDTPTLLARTSLPYPGNWTVWVKGRSQPGNLQWSSDSVHVVVNGQAFESVQDFTPEGNWSNQLRSGGTTTYVVGNPNDIDLEIEVKMRENGFILEEIVLTEDGTTPPAFTVPAGLFDVATEPLRIGNQNGILFEAASPDSAWTDKNEEGLEWGIEAGGGDGRHPMLVAGTYLFGFLGAPETSSGVNYRFSVPNGTYDLYVYRYARTNGSNSAYFLLNGPLLGIDNVNVFNTWTWQKIGTQALGGTPERLRIVRREAAYRIAYIALVPTGTPPPSIPVLPAN